MWTWEKLKKEDVQARENFAVEFGPYITRRLCRLGFQKEDAEDCSTDGIMAILDRLSQFEAREPVEQKFRSWAWTVAYHVAESWRRSYRPDLLDPLPPELPDPEINCDNDPIEAREHRARENQEIELRELQLRAMVKRLPDKYRQIIQNKAFEGEATFEQVAEILKIAPGTARQRYHRAIKLLRRIATEGQFL